MAETRPNLLLRWSFFLMLASIPFELPRRQTLPIEVPTLTAAIFLAVTMLQPRRCYGRIPGAVWPFVGFLCALALSASLNFLNSTSELMQAFLLLIQGVLVLWAAANLLEDETTAKGALFALAIACVLRAALPLVGIGRTQTHVWTGGERLTAFGQNENNAAMILAGGLIVLLGIGYGRARPLIKQRLLLLPGAAVIAYATVESGSRGGLLALVAGVLTLLLFRRESAWARARSGVVALLALAVIATIAYQTPVMHNRLNETAESGAMAGREELYPLVGQMFLEKPLLGWGPLNNQYELSLREGNRFLNRAKRDTHSIIFEALTASGLLGTLMFCLGLGLSLRAAWRSRPGPEGVLPLALCMTVVVANLSGNWMASKLLWFAFGYAIAGARRAARVSVTPLPQTRPEARRVESVTDEPAVAYDAPPTVRVLHRAAT